MTSNVDPVRRSPRYQCLLAELRSGQKTVLLDGPISTELDSRGVTMASGKARRVAKDDPESLVQLHVDYTNAGARIITTHTFGGTRDVLGREFEELTRGAVDCALEARRRTRTEDSVIVAGSLAYHSAKGPGKYDPTQDPEAWERDINDKVDLLRALAWTSCCSRWSGGQLLLRPSSGQCRQIACPFGLASLPRRLKVTACESSTTPLLALTTPCQVSSSSPSKVRKECSRVKETAAST